MKTIFFLSLISLAASAAVESKSVYTNVNDECVVISAANQKAQIDFYEAECKSFGGYQLKIKGGDLRYGPELSYQGKILDLQRPYQFHDMGSDKVEWMYTHDVNQDGSGSIQWIGFIYRLSVATDVKKDETVLYAVRLNGETSCVLGTVKTNEEARALVLNREAACSVRNDND